MRKTVFFLLISLLLLSLLPAYSENLLVNPDFSELNDDGLPAGWYEEVWAQGRTRFSVEPDANGENALCIFSFENNDASLVQDVRVTPDTVYKFSCLAKAERMDGAGKLGASISFLNTQTYSDSVTDTEGEWVRLTLYGKTGSDQKSLQLAARLGGYGYDTTGKVYFKAFTMETADESELRALGISPVSLSTLKPESYQNDFSSNNYQSEEAPARHTENHLAVSFFTLLIALYFLKAARQDPARGLASPNKAAGGVCALTAILVIGFAVRVYLAFAYRGYAVDVNNFMYWGATFFPAGSGFYMQSGLHDYPPLYMLLLGILDTLRRLLGIGMLTKGHVFLVKLIPILCDLALGALAFFTARRKLTKRGALLIACAIIFSPAFLINSAAWGQVDSVLTLTICLCLLWAMDGKWLFALPMFAVSMLLKPQALLFGPLGLAGLAFDAYRERKNKHALFRMLLGVLTAFAILYLFALPFAAREALASGKNVLYVIISPLPWLVNLYTGTTAGYSYITVNALNLYQLFDLNWISTASASSYYALGWWLMIGAYVYSACLVVFSRSRRSLALSGAVLISLIFAFAPMMHERYLFPALALLILSYLEHRDKRLLYVLLVFTITQYLNQALVLQCGMSEAYASMGHLSSQESLLNKFVSAVNVLAALYLCVIAFRILLLGKCRSFKIVKKQEQLAGLSILESRDHRLRLTLRDYILMLSITLVYAVFTFINLGATKAPQTFYKNTEYKEQIVFDLGETQTFRMTYYGGISSATFTVSFSNDGESWTEENYAVYGEGEIFRWHWFVPKTYENRVYQNAAARTLPDSARPLDAHVNYASSADPYPLQTARYARITINGYGLPLHEVGFWDVQNQALYEIKSVTGSVEGAAYRNLVDEQDTVAFAPSYFNGTYFDEIYHARTAYEFINQLPVLEWSHPHLGKILIMLGIEIFGMTPFGWRFMGALVGVLMLPAMYLMIKQLTKKTSLSLIGMLLLCFDSMHFTQSRIATVDTYAVFFIMLMYLFMFRYLQMNLHREKLRKTFIPLGLCGFTFGLACASKWIGLYAGVGLAVLFFSGMIVRFQEYRRLRAYIKNRPNANKRESEEQRICAAYPKKAALTLAFCVLMFIVVPVVIYFLTYYWHFAPEGNFNIRSVWNMQKQMFNYHNGLAGDTHYFRSPWYEWPAIVKPMWYYSADVAYVGKGIVSSISCMGNPVVWWLGAIAMLIVALLPALTKRADKTALIIAVGFASQYLPWMLIVRSTFIYHYFASVPFIILATVYLLGKLKDADKYAFCITSVTICSLALALFIAFYPLESGWPCLYEYALRLRWFNWYNFALQ